MKRLILIISTIALTLPSPAKSAVPLDYYLPSDISYNPAIPTPEAFFGYQVGDWHLRPDQINSYISELAALSDRITFQEYGRTYEQRPLILLTITSARNHRNLEKIREDHIRLSDPAQSASLSLESMPVVVWMGYSIHGNEPSGSNAVPLIAYYLAAADNPEIDDLLNESVILLDPSQNPDGLSRFAHWANTHRGKHAVADPNHREHLEAWPTGRTNHYWFDLNRDWLLLQQPETRGKMEQFHAWKPNLLTDHHEMQTHRTFFFQPGIPSRNYPHTPESTYELTAAIAKYHAEALDETGTLYYTKEGYDDFYIGKGSTYPDLNGGVGILFEQASARGHQQNTAHGLLTFPFAIRNQITTTLSTLAAAKNLRENLLEHQRTFYVDGLQLGERNETKAYVFGTETDPARNYHFLDLLIQHQIQVFELAKDTSLDGTEFTPGSAYVVPTGQPQFRLIEGLFETRTTFQDSLFYDVSAWTLPLAFNLPYGEMKARLESIVGNRIDVPVFPEGSRAGQEPAYAYAFNWNGYYAPRALFRLQNAGIKTKVATQPFEMITEGGKKSFGFGAIIIPSGIQQEPSRIVDRLVDTIVREDGIHVYSLNSGLSSGGIDLGSPSFSSLTKPSILLLVGNGVSGYAAGEIWHLLDQRNDIPVSLVENYDLADIDLSSYNTIVLPDTSNSVMDSRLPSVLTDWIRAGGTLIAQGSGVKWLLRRNIVSHQSVQSNRDSIGFRRPYAGGSRDRGARVIGGAIFQANLDRTHPLGYGFNQPNVSVFRSGTTFLSPSRVPYATPLQYTQNPLLSGYISSDNLEKIKNSASTLVHSLGSGRVILFMDNPNFRAIWYGTHKLFLNSIFFGPTIQLDFTQSGE